MTGILVLQASCCAIFRPSKTCRSMAASAGVAQLSFDIQVNLICRINAIGQGIHFL